MRVFLTNNGNPDRFQDPDSPLPGSEAGIWHPVNSLEQASEACTRYIEDNGLGGGNWCGDAGRIVQGADCIARVSYNGKVWPPGEWQPDLEPLYVPTRSETGR